ncbi:MAG: RecX family transcriptional regulator [Myxococcaceae bacterium]|nr:RecX family transcriptional regulator [Myxococcaceae bacterium]
MIQPGLVTEDSAKTQRRTRKKPRKISPRSLENAALFYLQRYSATAKTLKRVLLRKVDRSLRVHEGGDRNEARGWVDALLEKLIRNGLLDDRAYAHGRAQSLRAGGRSSRAISQKLRMKGVSAELLSQTLATATSEVSEEEAARIWAKKKRLGPYARDASQRAEQRTKHLAAMARAGFSFALAKKIVDGPVE